MGRWGLGTFEDDKALDWLADLREASAPEDLIASLLQPMDFGEVMSYGESVARQCLGEVVAAVAGYPPDVVPIGLKELLSAPEDDPLTQAIRRVSVREAVLLVSRVGLISEARVVAEESGALDDWLRSIQELLGRLLRVAHRAT